jgi:uncharacterized protein (DUF2267 family)
VAGGRSRRGLPGRWVRMTEQEFVAEVARRAGLDDDEARMAIRATLRALARRLPPDVPAEVVEHIPGRLGDIILPGHLPDGIPQEGRGEVFDIVELYHRIARERDITAAKARKEAQAVGGTLALALPGDVLTDVSAQLTPDYAELFDKEFATPELPDPDPL